MMDEDRVQRIVEAALLAADGPLTVADVTSLFQEGELDSENPSSQIRGVLKKLETDAVGRGVELKRVASGYRFQVRQELSQWVSRLWDEKPPRYTRALLETLALIAYKQPVTRGDIEQVRGVSVSQNIMRTLLERDWIRAVGQREVPGRPSLYATTRGFLDYFNLRSLDELPPLAEIRELLEPQVEEAVAAGAPDPADAPEASGEGDAASSEADEAIDAAPTDGSAESTVLTASVEMPAADADDESAPQSAEVVPLHSGGSHQQP